MNAVPPSSPPDCRVFPRVFLAVRSGGKTLAVERGGNGGGGCCLRMGLFAWVCCDAPVVCLLVVGGAFGFTGRLCLRHSYGTESAEYFQARVVSERVGCSWVFKSGFVISRIADTFSCILSNME